MKLYIITENGGDGSVNILLTTSETFVDDIHEIEDYPYDSYEDFGCNEEQSFINLPDDFPLDTLGKRVYKSAQEFAEEHM